MKKLLILLVLAATGCTLPSPTIFIDSISKVVVTDISITDYPGVHDDIIYISLKEIYSGEITQYRTSRDAGVSLSVGDTLNYAKTHSSCRGK